MILLVSGAGFTKNLNLDPYSQMWKITFFSPWHTGYQFKKHPFTFFPFILVTAVLWIVIVFMPIQIRISIKTMPIHVRILSQVLHMVMLENLNFIYFYMKLKFTISGMGVIILLILNSLLKFSGKKLKIHLLGIYTDSGRPDPDPQHCLTVKDKLCVFCSALTQGW